MRKSKALAKIRSGEPARLCALGHFIPAYIKHAAHFGYDCIWLDLEHRTISEREIQSMLALFHLADIDCMLRPPTTEKTRLYRYLEEGATGLMIPHVSTPEKAKELVEAVKFPPLGERGLDAAGLDADFLLGDTSDYIEGANRETFLVVQIETPQAVENIDAIAAVEGVDGLFIGPGDLSMRLKLLPEATLTLEATFQKVAAAASKHGKAWGCPASSQDQVARLRKMGAQLVVFGGDFLAVMEMLRKCGEQLDAVYASTTPE